MSKSIKGYFLGRPHASIEAWINGQPIPPVPPVPPTDDFCFMYKRESDTEWQKYVPEANDIQQDEGNVYIIASNFKQMDVFADVREVKLPNKWNNGSKDLDVTSIGDQAFKDCGGLTSVTIPENVTSIGARAFGRCNGLTNVEFEGNAPIIGTNAFVGVASGCKAIISPTAIGFNVDSQGKWNGLIVEIKGNQFNFLYKLEGSTEWQEYEPRENDIKVVDGNVTIAATDLTMQSWFSDVREVRLPNKWNNGTEDVDVTSIGSYVFDGRTNLTSVTIPDSVTNIGACAFYGCSGLTSVTIPDSVTSIGWSAFSGCTNLTSVTIPNSVTSIGNDVFRDCSGLTSVIIGNGVESIGNNTFWGCNSLTSVMIGNSVTSIGERAFWTCFRLTSVTIPASVTSIGGYAFYQCYNLTSVTILGSVTSIGIKAFYRCSRLTTVEFEGNAPTVGTETFAYVAENCKAVIDPAKEGWPAHRELWNNLIIEYKFAPDGKVLYRTTAGGEWLQDDADISDGAFNGFAEKSSAVEVILPSKDASGNDVTSIGNYAFDSCSGLRGVTIPDGVTSIGENAFRNCSGLTSVTISNNVMNIGTHAFYYCSALTSVTIPDGVKRIESAVFKMCSNLTNVTIPATVMSIGDEAFADCSGITSMTIPNRVTSIGTSAFYKCTSLTSVEFEGDAPTIGSFAFNCVALGCKAVISSTATGFDIDSQRKWNGLIVEVKS